VNDVQDGVFSELKADAPKVDPLRRQLQKHYVDILKREFEPAAGPAADLPIRRGPAGDDSGPRVSELRGVSRVALRKLDGQITAALPKIKDAATKAHLEDTLAEIRSILDESKKK
jgi:hypothetical protein